MTLGTEGLDVHDRALLATLAFYRGGGYLLASTEIRRAQKLESLGLCTVEAERMVTTYGQYGGRATITAAGWRLLRGPELATVAGVPVPPRGEGYFTPQSVIDAICNALPTFDGGI